MAMTDASAEYFEKVAGQWDEIRAGYFTEAVREAAIANAYLRPEMAVADVGAGTGFVAAGLAPLVKRVYAVDGSAAMLEMAKKKLSQFTNVEFHEADGANLPFPEESLDAVFANMYLHHVLDPLAAIREMVRVLRPGGRLVITDMDAHPYAWLKEEMADVWQGFEREQVRGWFRETGFVNIIVSSTGQSCCAEPVSAAYKDSQGREVRISIFVATGTRRMAMRDAVQENYAAIARSGSSCGCSSGEAQAQESCCSGTPYEEVSVNSTGYSFEELSTAPREAAEISLGCGNPTGLAGLKPGEVVLDIGSGGGLDAFIAAGKVGPRGKVIGVDMTPAMLERARASAEKNGIGNVEFRQGYAELLPVEDGTVDVIISNCVINLTEDKGQVFREAFRALKPGGRLEVSDIVTSGPVPMDLRGDAAGWSECVTGALPEQEYLGLIAEAGFGNVALRRSAVSGEIGGVQLYSAIVAAKKGDSKGTLRILSGEDDTSGSCGCGSSGCC
ncbi:MAG TPA: arsenite methyltransferase [Anaerolineaceae bacterium]|nr:arsenite methyltransferase [Anaerolineaceae bacterium]